MKNSQRFKIFTTIPNDGTYLIEAFIEKEGFNPQFTSVEMIDFDVIDRDVHGSSQAVFLRSDYTVDFVQPQKLKNGPRLSRLTGIPVEVEYLDADYFGHTKVAIIAALTKLRLRANETLEVEPAVINVEYRDGQTRNYAVLINGRKFNAAEVRGAMKGDGNELVNIDTNFGDYDYQHQVGLVVSCTRQ